MTPRPLSDRQRRQIDELVRQAKLRPVPTRYERIYSESLRGLEVLGQSVEIVQSGLGSRLLASGEDRQISSIKRSKEAQRVLIQARKEFTFEDRQGKPGPNR